MQPSYILALSTAVPDYFLNQNQVADVMIKRMAHTPKKKEFVRRVCQGSDIGRRYVVLPDFEPTETKSLLFSQASDQSPPTTKPRNDVYKQEAPKLALKAAKQVISEWQQNPLGITHIVSVSCTGVMAPGIEFLLLDALGLPRATQRLGINFMGCFGAFKGLLTANALACQAPHHRVLVVCTELCSLHFQSNWSAEQVVANALFADGAAAAIVGCDPQANEVPLWELSNFHSCALTGSREQMTWEAHDTGFVMRLSTKIPDTVKEATPAFVKTLLCDHPKQTSYNWAIHPGGKAILKGLQEVLELTDEQLAVSRHVLHEYGNMSSPTVLFVLEEMRKRGEEKPWTISLGFGPGLSIEGMLLKNGLV